jgi:hypothetical protein
MGHFGSRPCAIDDSCDCKDDGNCWERLGIGWSEGILSTYKLDVPFDALHPEFPNCVWSLCLNIGIVDMD